MRAPSNRRAAVPACWIACSNCSSVASSRIEGLEVGARRLLRAEAAKELGERSLDVTTAEVLGNINAMNSAIRDVGAGDPITLDVLLDSHRRLFADTRLSAQAGRLRDK